MADTEQGAVYGPSPLAVPDEATDLEAARLARSFPLPTEELREIAARNPPPQGWYEETGEPF
jgi:hypothetical protein